MRLVVIAVLCTGALLAACTSAPPPAMTAGDYRDEIQHLANAHADEVDAIRGDYDRQMPLTIKRIQRDIDPNDAAAREAFGVQALAATRTATAKMLAAIGDSDARYRDALAALVPPPELASPHDALVSAYDVAVATLPDLLAQVTGADSFDAITRALAGSGYADVQPRIAAACHDLEEQLAATGQPADLRCS